MKSDADRSVDRRVDRSAPRTAEAGIDADSGTDSAIPARNDLLARVAHDLRSPLNAMVGWLYLLKSARSPPEMLAQALAGLDSAVARQLHLVEQLQQVSHLLSHGVTYTYSDVDVIDLLRRLAQSHAGLAATHNVTVSVSEEGSVSRIRTDGGRLEASLSAFVDNAIRHGLGQGSVSIHACAAAESVVVTIRDCGIGLSASELNNINAPLDRVGPAHECGKIALSIAIARTVIEQLGGTVSITSDGPGTGTVVTVWLRIGRLAAKRQSATRKARDGPLNGLHTWIFSDHFPESSVLAELLRRHGVDVRAARATNTTLAEYANWSAGSGDRFVLLRWGASNRAGESIIQLLRHAERNAGAARTPGVAISNRSTPPILRDVVAAGYDALLLMPFDATELLHWFEARLVR